MKIVTVALIIAALSFLSKELTTHFIPNSKQMKQKSSSGLHQTQTLEEKLEVLNSCGLHLAPPFTVKELLKSWDRKDFGRRIRTNSCRFGHDRGRGAMALSLKESLEFRYGMHI